MDCETMESRSAPEYLSAPASWYGAEASSAARPGLSGRRPPAAHPLHTRIHGHLGLVGRWHCLARQPCQAPCLMRRLGRASRLRCYAGGNNPLRRLSRHLKTGSLLCICQDNPDVDCLPMIFYEECIRRAPARFILVSVANGQGAIRRLTGALSISRVGD